MAIKDARVKAIVVAVYQFLVEGLQEQAANPEMWLFGIFRNTFKSVREEINFLDIRLKVRSMKEKLFSLVILVLSGHKLKEFLSEAKTKKKLQQAYSDGFFVNHPNFLLILEFLGSVDNLKLNLESDLVSKYSDFLKEKN